MMRGDLAVQFESRMRGVVLVVASALAVLAGQTAFAQDPPPPLPRVVVDLHGVVPVLPNDAAQLALSRPIPNRDLQPTANYGGGARWFAKRHLAFSVDVRLYEIQPGTSVAGRPGSPRTRLFVIGAGISLK